jgi:hypothetical protein
MQIPASVSKATVHPQLAALPAGFWVVSLLCDLLYLGGAAPELWSRLALYTMVGGLVGALTLLTLPGFVAHMNVDGHRALADRRRHARGFELGGSRYFGQGMNTRYALSSTRDGSRRSYSFLTTA